MTDRPHTFTVRSNDDRRLASTAGLERVGPSGRARRWNADRPAAEFAAFTLLLPRVARDAGITLFELRPTDESLESVFAYLVRR